MLITTSVVITGCAAPASGKKAADTSNLKLGDFSELKVPGNGHSALFIMNCYDVEYDKFAIVRIMAGQAHNVLPAGERGESIRKDGIFAAVVRGKQQETLAAMLNESGAEHTRKTTLMFYDTMLEDFWVTGINDRGSVVYKDAEGVSHTLEMEKGFLGVSFGISFERRLLGIPFTISPQYRQRDALPKAYLQKLGSYNENGQMSLSQLSFTAPMNIDDFLVICPDMVPLDEGSFSSYAFRGKRETTFRIYCIYCKNITGI